MTSDGRDRRRERRTGRARRRPARPRRTPPRRARGSSDAEHRRPRHRRPACATATATISRDARAVTIAMAAMTAEPAAQDTSGRATRGVDRTSSRRSLALVATPSPRRSSRPASPRMSDAEAEERQLQEARRLDAGRCPGRGCRDESLDLAAATRIASANASADPAMSAAYRPIPTPHAIATPGRSASCRVNGPRIPAGSDGRRSQRERARAARGRAARSRRRRSRGGRRSTTASSADRRPVGDPGDRAVAGGPVEPGQRAERVDERRQRRRRRR